MLRLLCGVSSPQFVRVGSLLFVRAIYTDLLPLDLRLTRMSAV